MVKYTLTYFNGRGRAEVIRMIFAEAGVEYEDVRVAKDQWSALKPKSPFGQIPILEIDGKMFCQSISIARHLARKFKLAGKTEFEELQADMLVDCMEDAVKPMMVFLHEPDEARKADLKKKFEEALPTSLGYLENFLKSNNGGDGYFVGDGLTWADINFLTTVKWLKMAGYEAVVDKYPKLKSLNDRVEKLPKIAAWIAKRPVTEF